MSKIIIAIPRGRIIKKLKKILIKTSFAPEEEMFDNNSRKLTFMSKFSIAITRGRIIKEIKPILKKTSFAPENAMFDDKSRKLKK